MEFADVMSMWSCASHSPQLIFVLHVINFLQVLWIRVRLIERCYYVLAQPMPCIFSSY